MTGWLIPVILIVLLASVMAITIYAYRVNLRARRQRRYFRHITGIEEWWGKR